MKKHTEILTISEFYARADRIVSDLSDQKTKSAIAKEFGTSRSALYRMTEKHSKQDDGLRRRIIEKVEGVEIEILYRLKKMT